MVVLVSKNACVCVLGSCRSTLQLVTACALVQILKQEHAILMIVQVCELKIYKKEANGAKSHKNYLSRNLLIWYNFLSVEYSSLGCFKDGTPHALPLLLKSFRNNIDWNDMTKIVRACAEIAKERGLPIFGIQFYGECWSGLDAENTYNKYGPSGNCWNGVGKKGTYHVYKI